MHRPLGIGRWRSRSVIGRRPEEGIKFSMGCLMGETVPGFPLTVVGITISGSITVAPKAFRTLLISKD